MKLTLFPVLVLACGLAGCSGVTPHGEPVGPSHVTPQIMGNWQLMGTSTQGTKTGTPAPMGIYITQNGNTITGKEEYQLAIPALVCVTAWSDVNAQLAGTIDSDGNVVLKSIAPTPDGSVLTITGNASAGNTLVNGTYSVAGGCVTDSGTLTGNAIAPVNGTYSGTLTSSHTGVTMAVTTTLDQTSSPASNGMLLLSGNANFNSSNCQLTTTVGSPASLNSGLSGSEIGVSFATSSSSTAVISLTGSVSPDSKTLTVQYSVLGAGCAFDAGSGTLMLQ